MPGGGGGGPPAGGPVGDAVCGCFSAASSSCTLRACCSRSSTGFESSRQSHIILVPLLTSTIAKSLPVRLVVQVVHLAARNFQEGVAVRRYQEVHSYLA